MAETPDPLADVSRETAERLHTYEMLLREWNPTINLVSASTLDDASRRHFADSAQLLPLAPQAARTWVDLGSGGGFPGLVVAILAAERRPNLAVSLVESDARKVAFLAAVLRSTGVAARVVHGRAETVPAAPSDVVSARALAPLDRLLPLAVRFLAPGGLGLFPKGRHAGIELTAAARHWHYRVREVVSRTDPAARILCMTEIRRGE